MQNDLKNIENQLILIEKSINLSVLNKNYEVIRVHIFVGLF